MNMKKCQHSCLLLCGALPDEGDQIDQGLPTEQPNVDDGGAMQALPGGDCAAGLELMAYTGVVPSCAPFPNNREANARILSVVFILYLRYVTLKMLWMFLSR